MYYRALLEGKDEIAWEELKQRSREKGKQAGRSPRDEGTRWMCNHICEAPPVRGGGNERQKYPSPQGYVPPTVVHVLLV